jgi:hypothetical protein
VLSRDRRRGVAFTTPAITSANVRSSALAGFRSAKSNAYLVPVQPGDAFNVMARLNKDLKAGSKRIDAACGY